MIRVKLSNGLYTVTVRRDGTMLIYADNPSEAGSIYDMIRDAFGKKFAKIKIDISSESPCKAELDFGEGPFVGLANMTKGNLLHEGEIKTYAKCGGCEGYIPSEEGTFTFCSTHDCLVTCSCTSSCSSTVTSVIKLWNPVV